MATQAQNLLNIAEKQLKTPLSKVVIIVRLLKQKMIMAITKRQIS